MDPWIAIDDLARSGRITDEQVTGAHRLVRSAAAAGVGLPRLAVGRELLARLRSGEPVHYALVAIEDQIAVAHNRTLIARGSGRAAHLRLVDDWVDGSAA